MITSLQPGDREKIERILVETGNFNGEEIAVALELIDIYLNNKDQKDYEIYVDRNDEDDSILNGYICIGPRPMTKGTYDLYWIAVNPHIQSKGIGSRLVTYIESVLSERGAALVLIETSGKPSYEKERKFYEKNMYEKLVEIKDFYDKNDSLVIYGKYLKQ
jgi:GNAT superfamily N-acetyltransferase